MARPFEDEMEVRKEQRQRYFEDENYQKWSDIMPENIFRRYEGTTDDDFFIHYLFGKTRNTPTTLLKIREQLDEGRELPINWDSLYAYFDERYNDPHNGFKHQLVNNIYYTVGFDDHVSVMELLEEYRDSLTTQYDIV